MGNHACVFVYVQLLAAQCIQSPFVEWYLSLLKPTHFSVSDVESNSTAAPQEALGRVCALTTVSTRMQLACNSATLPTAGPVTNSMPYHRRLGKNSWARLKSMTLASVTNRTKRHHPQPST